MFIDSKMMKTNYLLERALDVESTRRKVIANNIANVDVPHFKRSEVNFEAELQRVVEMNKEIDKNRVPAKMSSDRHIAFFQQRNIRSVQPRINLDYNTTYRNDGNNVDIEKEMVDSAKNLMRYNAFVSSLSHNYRMLKMALRNT